MSFRKTAIILAFLLASISAFADVYGAIRGVVHDPQHRPVQGAMVMLKAKSSDLGKTATTGANGEFQFNAVPLGDYSVTVVGQGFEQASQDVTVISGTVPVAHFQLQLASAHEKVTVSAEQVVVPTDSATPITLVNSLDIARTPGADRTNSLAMITDYTPGAYVTHDMLHMR
ncbi:MAG: carboxypeptidase-like regulatory domain-containing protein, partial [Candidatus Sulfotelmatobacter sp.]